MHVTVLRQLALLLAALCPVSAFALSETYEGQLIPGTGGAPIAIAVEMEQVGGFLTGKIRTSHPLKFDASIDSGRNIAGSCNLISALSTTVTLRLSGSCSSTSFEGTYTLQYRQSKNVTGGTFRLTKKVSDPGKDGGSGLTTANVATGSVVACVKANTRCLAACPRDDANVEYLCANHCRTKLNACKAKANKPVAVPDSP
jgi:hypothetical protein